MLADTAEEEKVVALPILRHALLSHIVVARLLLAAGDNLEAVVDRRRAKRHRDELESAQVSGGGQGRDGGNKKRVQKNETSGFAVSELHQTLVIVQNSHQLGKIGPLLSRPFSAIVKIGRIEKLLFKS